MSGLWDRLLALPFMFRMAAGGVAGGGVLYFLRSRGLLSFDVFLIITIGAAAIVLLVAGFRYVLKLRARKRARQLEDSLLSDAANAPSDLTADERQRHEEARQKFESGISRARAEGHGRLIGELPWYIVVGEPASGKSMAIKRSGMEFPFGDQEVQGTGGTLHMDWFFTDEAVLLDTAGNLFYERGDRDDPTRWVDFLKRVKRFRKHAPINGIFLFLPVNSLMEDTESDREEKAKRVAARLQLLRKELRIRCGVYIILSKADKLTGFREYTEALQASSPTAGRQMLGWSNPGSLDSPLDLGQVREGLAEIEESLRRRRFELISRYHQGQFERRIDMLDALYQLPNQVRELAAPLNSYLERIFPKGIWLKSSLFLRGIYLTSAEQTGSVIDTALARATGIPTDELRSPFVELQRSFFLRDMFIEKAFPEQGLVTHAEDAHKHYRRKKMIIGGTGLAAALLLAGVSAWRVAAISNVIGTPTRLWERVARVFTLRDSGTALEELKVEFPESDVPGLTAAQGYAIPYALYQWDRKLGGLDAAGDRNTYGKAIWPYSMLRGGGDMRALRDLAIARVYFEFGSEPILGDENGTDRGTKGLVDQSLATGQTLEDHVARLATLLQLEVNRKAAEGDMKVDGGIQPWTLEPFVPLLPDRASRDDDAVRSLDSMVSAFVAGGGDADDRRGDEAAVKELAKRLAGKAAPGVGFQEDSTDAVDRLLGVLQTEMSGWSGASLTTKQDQSSIRELQAVLDALKSFDDLRARLLSVQWSDVNSSALFDARAKDLLGLVDDGAGLPPSESGGLRARHDRLVLALTALENSSEKWKFGEGDYAAFVSMWNAEVDAWAKEQRERVTSLLEPCRDSLRGAVPAELLSPAEWPQSQPSGSAGAAATATAGADGVAAVGSNAPDSDTRLVDWAEALKKAETKAFVSIGELAEGSKLKGVGETEAEIWAVYLSKQGNGKRAFDAWTDGALRAAALVEGASTRSGFQWEGAPAGETLSDSTSGKLEWSWSTPEGGENAVGEAAAWKELQDYVTLAKATGTKDRPVMMLREWIEQAGVAATKRRRTQICSDLLRGTGQGAAVVSQAVASMSEAGQDPAVGGDQRWWELVARGYQPAPAKRLVSVTAQLKSWLLGEADVWELENLRPGLRGWESSLAEYRDEYVKTWKDEAERALLSEASNYVSDKLGQGFRRADLTSQWGTLRSDYERPLKEAMEAVGQPEGWSVQVSDLRVGSKTLEDLVADSLLDLSALRGEDIGGELMTLFEKSGRQSQGAAGFRDWVLTKYGAGLETVPAVVTGPTRDQKVDVDVYRPFWRKVLETCAGDLTRQSGGAGDTLCDLLRRYPVSADGGQCLVGSELDRVNELLRQRDSTSGGELTEADTRGYLGGLLASGWSSGAGSCLSGLADGDAERLRRWLDVLRSSGDGTVRFYAISIDQLGELGKYAEWSGRVKAHDDSIKGRSKLSLKLEWLPDLKVEAFDSSYTYNPSLGEANDWTDDAEYTRTITFSLKAGPQDSGGVSELSETVELREVLRRAAATARDLHGWEGDYWPVPLSMKSSQTGESYTFFICVQFFVGREQVAPADCFLVEDFN